MVLFFYFCKKINQMHQKFKVSFMCTFMFIKLFAYGCKTFASHQGQTQPIQPNFDHYHNIFNRHIDVHLYTRFFRSARTSCTTFGWFVRPVRKKNLHHLYTGIYALWIMKRLIKPTLWPQGIPWIPSWSPGTPWQPPNQPPPPKTGLLASWHS